MSIYVYTSVALNYFPKARVLSTTLKKFHPTWKFCILISEDIDAETRSRMLLYEDIDEVITYDQITITDGFGRNLNSTEIKQWCFKHSIVEFCTAVKGGALKYLLSKSDCEAVFYFDPDIAIFDDLTQLTDHFQTKSILLTPHLTDIEKHYEGVWDNEISTLKHGIYNLGFVGVKNDVNGHNFAQWWKDRLNMHCYADILNGVFTDQSWCDMVPAVFDGVQILRQPQYNVSTWNLNHRKVDGKDINNLYINDKYRLCFYHFSGFDSGAQLDMLNKYAQNMPMLFKLRDWYIDECLRLDNSDFSQRKWQFDYYNNNEKILHEHRIVYRTRDDLQLHFSDPFNSVPSLADWFENEYKKENDELAQQKVIITKKELELLESRDKLEKVLLSNSWRLTRPLRKLAKIFKG